MSKIAIWITVTFSVIGLAAHPFTFQRTEVMQQRQSNDTISCCNNAYHIDNVDKRHGDIVSVILLQEQWYRTVKMAIALVGLDSNVLVQLLSCVCVFVNGYRTAVKREMTRRVWFEFSQNCVQPNACRQVIKMMKARRQRWKSVVALKFAAKHSEIAVVALPRRAGEGIESINPYLGMKNLESCSE